VEGTESTTSALIYTVVITPQLCAEAGSRKVSFLEITCTRPLIGEKKSICLWNVR